MKRKLVLVLCACLTFASVSTIAATQNTSALAVSGMPGEGIELNVSRTSPEFTSISMSDPDIQIIDMEEDFETYQLLTIPGEPFIPEEGNPSVPHVTRFYRIPNTGNVDLIIRNTEFTVQEGINPYPYVPERSGFNRDNRNLDIYTKNDWYPSEIATISEPMIMRDFRVVTVTLNPVQVNPVTGQARVYSQINVDVVANGEPGTNELLNPRRPSGNWAPIYRDMITNLDETALDDATTTPGTYLILARTNNIVDMFVDSLADWKTRKGFDVVVDSRTGWSVTQMINTIRGLYESADPPLEYVCIMGDPTGSFSLPTDGTGSFNPGNYDHTFALGNTGDDLEDIAVGRFPCREQEDFSVINAKIMGYERNPYMTETEWYKKAFLYAGISHSIASNYTLMQWGDTQLSNNTGIDDNTVLTVNGDVSSSVIQNQLEDGRALFMWRGGWVGEMGSGIADQCNTGWRLPLCWTVTCGTGDFEDSSPDVSESWILAGSTSNPAGGICGIGTATLDTHAPQNICLAGGLLYAIANQKLEHLGNILSSSKLWLTLTFGENSYSAEHFSRYCNLMGDPGLSIWTDIPAIMDVSHPTTLNVGAREVSLTVLDSEDNPIEDALVVLWKGDRDNPETLTKALTKADGEITLPVTINTAGTLRLTVTKRNHKPHLYEIPCVVANEMLSYETATIDDDMTGGTSGNNNSAINPGERIDFTVTLKNHGSTGTATNVNATLSCDNPNITILDETKSFPDIPSGNQQAANGAFRFEVTSTMKHDEIAQFILAVSSDDGVFTSAINLPCQAGEVTYDSHQLSPSTLNPGDTGSLSITIMNTGLLGMNNATGYLYSGSPFVSVGTPSVNFGNIDIGQTVNNAGDMFEVTALNLTFPGHQASMLLILETSDGYRDSTRFNLTVGSAAGSDPAGPDGYGYYAYDNTDTEYELHPEFDYFNISSGLGTDLNINDVGEKNSTSDLWSVVRDLPFTVKYYGKYYDQVTICSNGWIAFGDQGWNDNFRNYPIPSMVGADAMICPYWDDLATSGARGVWEYDDSANARYVVQWKAGVGNSWNTPLDFQVILFDTTEYPTLDGNTSILFQYNDLPSSQPTNQPNSGGGNETSGCTIGIHNETATVGLGLAFKNDPYAGVASWVDGRAILITTDARALFGVIEGHVIDEETEQPMENVEVTLDGFTYSDETDSDGFYRIENVLIGLYTVRAHKFGFNDATVADIQVELDQTETVDFSMLHPEFELSTTAINHSIPPNGSTTSFDIINDGNGPLDYNVEIVYTGGGDPVDPWGNIEDVNVSELTGDLQILGCEFVGDYWYVSGGNGQVGNNKLYKFDLDGEYQGSISLPQPDTTAFGWFDLAYDGEYIYGSRDGTGLIEGIDSEGNLQVEINSPLNPTRAIAYDDATDRFWVADFTANIYEINRAGQIYSEVENVDTLKITGLAWNPTDPDGYKLYIFSRQGYHDEQPTLVSKMHPVSYDIQHLTVLEGEDGDRSGGCAVTGGWNSTLLVFGAVMQNSEGDRLGIYQVDFNTVWIDVDPMISSVEGGTSRELTLTFDTDILRNATYEVSLLIYNDVLDQTQELPVTLDVMVSAVDDPVGSEIVTEYALHQNYPNPFNPSTTIRYDLKNAGLTKLSVYNIVGQEVATLVNGVQQSGSHSIHFDAAGLTSGVYFYRLTSGDFSKTAKMVLMK